MTATSTIVVVDFMCTRAVYHGVVRLILSTRLCMNAIAV